MGDDDITLVPEYRFDWSRDDAETRNTSDIEGGERFPEALEQLAEFGKADPECDVTLIGYAN